MEVTEMSEKELADEEESKRDKLIEEYLEKKKNIRSSNGISVCQGNAPL